MKQRFRKTNVKWACKNYGHDWAYYMIHGSYWSYDIEQGGECKRCGYDTHAD